MLCEAPETGICSENSGCAETMSAQWVIAVQGELFHQLSHAQNKKETTISMSEENLFLKMHTLMVCNTHVFLLLTFEISTYIVCLLSCV